MNNYYAFNNTVTGITIDFHLWMVIFIVSLAIMVVVGIRQYQIVDLGNGDCRIRKLHKDSIYLIITIISTAIFATVFFIAEYMQNGAINSKPIFATIVFLLIVYYTGRIAGWARYGFLHDKRRK